MEYALEEVVGFGRDGETTAEVVWITKVGTERVIFIVRDGPGIGLSDDVD